MTAKQWQILCVLFVARFALGFQFQSAGSVTPFLITDFSMDYRQVGALIGLFMLPGIVLAIASGYVGNRWGDKIAVLFGLVLMSVGGVLTSVADSYTVLAAGRLTSGAGATFLFVLMAKMVIDWFDRRTLFLQCPYLCLAGRSALRPDRLHNQYWPTDFRGDWSSS